MNKSRNGLYKGKWFHEMTREELIDALIEQGEAYMHQADETLRAELRGLEMLREARSCRGNFAHEASGIVCLVVACLMIAFVASLS